MKTLTLATATLLAAVSLSGCDRLDAAWQALNGAPKPPVAPVQPASPVDPAPAQPTSPGTPLVAANPGVPMKAVVGEEGQVAASVVKIDTLTKSEDMDVKLFGTGGGDPAMNGLYTYIAFFRSPAQGWWIYKLGDFLDYRLLGESSGKVDLELTESTYDEATGTIGSRTRRIVVTFTVGPVGDQPVLVRVAPAQ